MARILVGIPFALVLVLILLAERTFNLFTIWNCLPVISGYAAMLGGIRMRGPIAVALISASIAVTFVPTIFHLAWLFDWQHTATGSSTSALAFIFAPIWAFILGIVVCGVSWCITFLVQCLVAANRR